MRKYRLIALISGLFLIASGSLTVATQVARTHITTGSSLPANCTVGDVFVKTGTSDGLYRCSATDTWTAIGGAGGGSGDVVGPSSATDNAIARFDGTTGKLLQNGAPLLADDGRITTITDPTSNQDAATKKYVDDLIAGVGGGSGAAYVLSGSGNPQGSVSAAVGNRYVDTSTGYWYQKLGGGSTAYGWYFQPITGGSGPTPFYLFSGDSTGVPVTSGLLSPTQTNNSSAVSFSDGFYNKSVTNSTTGTRGGWITAIRPQWWDTDFDLVIRMRTGTTLTDTRFWFGLTSTDLTNSNDVTANGTLFRYLAGTDGGFVGYSRDGTTSSVTATVNTIALNTAYSLRIRYVSSGTPTVYFSVNDGTEVSKTSNLPATGTAAGIAFYVYNISGTTQGVYFRSVAMFSGS